MAKGSKTEPFFFFSFKGYVPELFKSHYQGVKKEKIKLRCTGRDLETKISNAAETGKTCMISCRKNFLDSFFPFIKKNNFCC